uniref:Fatty acid desaturase, putative n=1 Tax=Schistosoma mansoni TaxID=6183 RepID=A0A3Q0KLZ3_SCHMA
MAKGLFNWGEVKKHQSLKDRWIVIDNKVYDVSSWQNKHPGGRKVIGHYAGQDATGAFIAFHKNRQYAEKFLSAYYIGDLDQDCPEDKNMNSKIREYHEDLESIRKILLQQRLFDGSKIFFGTMMLQVFVLELLAYLNLAYFGTSWWRIMLSIILYSISQGQASWLQHDLGHLSVFRSTRTNHIFHEIILGLTKGASCHWWNHMHSQHHAKPNVIDKDPDTRLEPIFVVGDNLLRRAASPESKWTWHFPYEHQHKYFFLIGPPLLFPVYFQIMSFRHMWIHKRIEDFLYVMGFWAKLLCLYYSLLGFWGTLVYFFVIRVIESHWFTWVSQSNHLAMPVDYDRAEPWFRLQLNGTCNVENSLFNDWFTGHLNFQIEHHLFPTMPRHNYHIVKPYVKALCEKYNLPYRVKPIGIAFADIFKILKSSAELWKKVKCEQEKCMKKLLDD